MVNTQAGVAHRHFSEWYSGFGGVAQFQGHTACCRVFAGVRHQVVDDDVYSLAVKPERVVTRLYLCGHREVFVGVQFPVTCAYLRHE